MAEPEFYRDAKLDSDGDIIIADHGDLAVTQTQDENITQSVYLSVAGDLDRQKGRPITGEVLENIRSLIQSGLEEDPQVGEVLAVDITEINRVDNSVTARVIMVEDEDFEIEVDT